MVGEPQGRLCHSHRLGDHGDVAQRRRTYLARYSGITLRHQATIAHEDWHPERRNVERQWSAKRVTAAHSNLSGGSKTEPPVLYFSSKNLYSCASYRLRFPQLSSRSDPRELN